MVELGPEFLREYLRFNKGGDGRVELEPFIALVESTLLRRGLRVFRKQVRVGVTVRARVRVASHHAANPNPTPNPEQLEGMFRAADFDDDGVLDLKAFVEMANPNPKPKPNPNPP